MKLGIFLIFLAIILGIERAITFFVLFVQGEVNIIVILTLVLYTSIPAYFGIRRLLKVKNAKNNQVDS